MSMSSDDPVQRATDALVQTISKCSTEIPLHTSLLAMFSPLQACLTETSAIHPPAYATARYRDACKKLTDFSEEVLRHLPQHDTIVGPELSEKLASFNENAECLYVFLEAQGLFTAFAPTYAQQRLWDRIVHCFGQPPGQGLLRTPLLERNDVPYRTMFRSLDDYYACIQVLLSTESMLHHMATTLLSFLNSRSNDREAYRPGPESNAICPPADISRFLKICGAADKFVANLPDAPRNDAVQIKELFHQLCFTGFNFQDRMTFSLSTSSIRFPAILGATSRSVLYPATLHAQGDYENAFWDMPVVVKVFLPNENTKSREMYFRQEALRLNTLAHPCLLAVHDAHWPEEHDGQLNSDIFAVSERMSHNLQDAILLPALRSKKTRLRILLDVAHALAFLHRAGVVHRDISPENVLVRIHEHEWCGCAKVDVTNLLKYAVFPHAQRESRFSLYAPPESFYDQKEFYTRDVWSLGILACFLLTDQAPSWPAIPPNLMPRNGNLRPFIQLSHAWCKKISNPSLQGIIQACLRLDPAERPTAAMLISSLQSTMDRIDLSGQIQDEVIGGENHGDGNVDDMILDSSIRFREPTPDSFGELFDEAPLKTFGTSDSEGHKCSLKHNLKDPDWNEGNGRTIGAETGSSGSNSFQQTGTGRKRQPSRRAKRKRIESDDGSTADSPTNVRVKQIDMSPHLKQKQERMTGKQLSSPRENKIEKDELFIASEIGTDRGKGPNDGSQPVLFPRSHSRNSEAPKAYLPQKRASTEDEYALFVGQSGAISQIHNRIEADKQNLKAEALLVSGTPGCLEKSAALFKMAADAGSAKAQVNYGHSLENGRGVAQDYCQAALYFQEAAKQGDPRGQLKIGLCHEQGLGTKKDLRVAVEWYTKAADQGDFKAQANLGIALEHGRGIQKDLNKAIQYYRLAAKAGSSVAHLNLGVLYEEGRWVEQDFARAVDLYSKAADLGNNLALHNLGLCYEKGIGVKKDVLKAIRLHIKAADAGEMRAQFRAGQCFEHGEGVKQNLVKAFKYYEASAKQHFVEAMRKLGTCYEEGKGVQHSFSSAFKLYEAASKQGDPMATFKLACCYEKGKGVKKSPTLAVSSYKQAAQKQNPEAAVALGYMYEKGEGVKKSTTEAVRLYRFAASKGLPAGEAALGQCHYYAYGMPKNIAMAVRLYESASSKGNEDACVDLGMLYRDGAELKQNYEKAFELFQRAAAKGNAAALLQLGECYFYGRGVSKDLSKAVEQFSRSTLKGEAEAYRWLGDCYADGIGVPVDMEKAVYFFQKGASAGSTEAMTNLGCSYERGHGVQVNGQKAFNLYKKAADKMNTRAMNNLGILFERGQFVKQDYQRAFRWYSKAVQNDGIEALCNLADCYAEGNGVEKDMTKAVKYYKEGVASGLPEAQCELGICYYYGKGVHVDFDHAIKLLQDASKSEPEAIRHLGIVHYDGSGVPQDEKKALELYFCKAAELGNKDAYLEIAQCHELGRGTDKDVPKAVEYYQKAADAGNMTAMRCLGNMYFSGQGVEVNKQKASELYERSASLKWEDLGK